MKKHRDLIYRYHSAFKFANYILYLILVRVYLNYL